MLAKASGITKASLLTIESGKAVTLDYILELGQFFGYGLHELTRSRCNFIS